MPGRCCLRNWGTELNTSETHFIGLRYPGRHGGFEWLMLCMLMRKKSAEQSGIVLLGEEQKRDLFERTQVDCLRVHAARPEELQVRNTSVVQTQVHSKTVAMIGLGALGGRVSELLAQGRCWRPPTL